MIYAKTLSTLAVTLILVSIASEAIGDYNIAVRETQESLARQANGGLTFGIYGDWGDIRKLYRLILAFLMIGGWICVLKFSNPLASILLYLGSLLVFVVWISSALEAIRYWEPLPDKTLSQILSTAANPFDYVLLTTVFLLFYIQLRTYRPPRRVLK